MSQNRPPSQRQLRVGEQLRQSLSSIFLHQDFFGAELLQGTSVTVSEVRISPDLKNATVYVSPLGSEPTSEFISCLNEVAPQLRFTLGKSVKLRYTPKLFFKMDQSFDNANHIETLLDSVRTDAVALESEA